MNATTQWTITDAQVAQLRAALAKARHVLGEIREEIAECTERGETIVGVAATTYARLRPAMDMADAALSGGGGIVSLKHDKSR